MPMLEICLLGDFQIAYGTAARPQFAQVMKQPRLQALLAYLLLHRSSPAITPAYRIHFLAGFD